VNLFKRTLIITPHFDDETIGCGGLMSSLSMNPDNQIKVVVVATNKSTYNYNVNRVVNNDERKLESINALAELGVPKESLIQLDGFEDGRLDMCDRKSLVTVLDSIIRTFKPTAVLFPYSSHHQDHQAVYQASIAALRPTVSTNFIQLKAMYEYPYVTSWSSSVNPDSKLYYPLSKLDIARKEAALKAYKSQLVRDPRDILDVSSIINLAKVRGTEIGHDYAEAFYPMTIIARDCYGDQ